MLRIIQSTNSAATKNYYSKSDYYVTGQEQEIVGRWGGKAAEALGLRGEVGRDDIQRDVRQPEPEHRGAAHGAHEPEPAGRLGFQPACAEVGVGDLRPQPG